jgi:hypothetical protein
VESYNSVVVTRVNSNFDVAFSSDSYLVSLAALGCERVTMFRRRHIKLVILPL